VFSKTSALKSRTHIPTSLTHRTPKLKVTQIHPKINPDTEENEEKHPEFKIKSFREELERKTICMQPIELHY